MPKLKPSDYKKYSKFLNNLANKLTKYYYLKLNKPFKVLNKQKGKGYERNKKKISGSSNYWRGVWP